MKSGPLVHALFLALNVKRMNIDLMLRYQLDKKCNINVSRNHTIITLATFSFLNDKFHWYLSINIFLITQ